MDSSMSAGTRMRDVIAPAACSTSRVVVGLQGNGSSIEATPRPRHSTTDLLVAGAGAPAAGFRGIGLFTAALTNTAMTNTAMTNAAMTNAAMTSKAATGTVRLRPPRDPLVV